MRSTNALLARVIVELRTQRAQIDTLTAENDTRVRTICDLDREKKALRATVDSQYGQIQQLDKEIQTLKKACRCGSRLFVVKDA